MIDTNSVLIIAHQRLAIASEESIEKIIESFTTLPCYILLKEVLVMTYDHADQRSASAIAWLSYLAVLIRCSSGVYLR